MPSLNRAIIMGHLGKDPVLRSMPDGKSVVNFSVAASESYKTKDGEKVEKVEWFNVVAFARLADICNEYLHKGDLVYIEGKFQTRKYEKDGQDRYITEVIANEMKMLGGKGDRTVSTTPAPAKKESPASGGSKFADMDDDIPFAPIGRGIGGHCI